MDIRIEPYAPQHVAAVRSFNARLGDPEAQVLLPLIAEPLAPILAAATGGRIERLNCHMSNEKLVGVVIASRGWKLATAKCRSRKERSTRHMRTSQCFCFVRHSVFNRGCSALGWEVDRTVCRECCRRCDGR